MKILFVSLFFALVVSLVSLPGFAQTSFYGEQPQSIYSPSYQRQLQRLANPQAYRNNSNTIIYGNPYGYNPYGYAPAYGQYPLISSPQAIGGGIFNFRIGNNTVQYWRAPSGYYYPYGAYRGLPYVPTVIYQQSGAAPAPAQPPLSAMIKDVREYLSETNKEGKLSSGDYESLSRRLKDLMLKEQSLRSSSGGSLDEGQEEQLRQDFQKLSDEITFRMK